MSPSVAIPERESSQAWSERVAGMRQRFDAASTQSRSQFTNLPLARERAAFIRWKVNENLDKLLIEFEANFIKSGGKVIWAQDVSEALLEIGKIVARSDSRRIIKSKTSTGNEIGLSAYLEQEGVQVTETDTGDFLLQNTRSESSHMVMNAMHRSMEQIRAESDLILGSDAGPIEIVEAVRKRIRDEYPEASVGISGCNFIVADPGALVILENEGNVNLTASMPETHIVVAGIDKVLPTLVDLGLFIPLLSTYGSGQEMVSGVNILSSPRQADEKEGPQDLFLVLLDNGRSDVLAKENQRQALSCIHCGACQFACPVFSAEGVTRFPSPVQAVTYPLRHPSDESRSLPFRSTLCGACKEACPVNIDLPSMLLESRRQILLEGQSGKSDKWFWFFWKKAMMRREIMNWKGIRAGKYIMGSLFRSREGLRKMPGLAPRSFNEIWREKMNFR